MTNTNTNQSNPISQINISKNAIDKVKDLIAEENNFDLKLRIFVTGGGCSGFQYGFTFEEAAQEDDFNLQIDNLTILVDSMSMQYLQGANVDYQEDVSGSRFIINNPNAVTTCGCGSSFAM